VIPPAAQGITRVTDLLGYDARTDAAITRTSENRRTFFTTIHLLEIGKRLPFQLDRLYFIRWGNSKKLRQIFVFTKLLMYTIYEK